MNQRKLHYYIGLFQDAAQHLRHLRKFRPKGGVYVFVISFMLVSCFWLLNALNKTYSEGVVVHIKYINMPENRVFSPAPLNEINLFLNGDGFTLFQLMRSAESDTVVIDLEKLDFVYVGETKKKAKVGAATIISSFKGGLNANVDVSKIGNDSIIVVTDIGVVKTLHIAPNYALSLKKGWVLKKPIYTQPNVVRVKGPRSILEKLDTLHTTHVTLNGVSKDVDMELDVMYNHTILKPEFTRVKLRVQVEALTEGDIEVPVHILGMPEDKWMRLLPNMVRIRFSTGLSYYDSISPDLFEVVIEYQDIKNNVSKIPVYLRTYPKYVHVIQFHPEQVGYLIIEMGDI